MSSNIGNDTLPTNRPYSNSIALPSNCYQNRFDDPNTNIYCAYCKRALISENEQNLQNLNQDPYGMNDSLYNQSTSGATAIQVSEGIYICQNCHKKANRMSYSEFDSPMWTDTSEPSLLYNIALHPCIYWILLGLFVLQIILLIFVIYYLINNKVEDAWFIVLDSLVVWTFVAELCLKLYVLKKTFFSSWINIVEMVVAGIIVVLWTINFVLVYNLRDVIWVVIVLRLCAQLMILTLIGYNIYRQKKVYKSKMLRVKIEKETELVDLSNVDSYNTGNYNNLTSSDAHTDLRDLERGQHNITVNGYLDEEDQQLPDSHYNWQHPYKTNSVSIPFSSGPNTTPVMSSRPPDADGPGLALNRYNSQISSISINTSVNVNHDNDNGVGAGFGATKPRSSSLSGTLRSNNGNGLNANNLNVTFSTLPVCEDSDGDLESPNINNNVVVAPSGGNDTSEFMTDSYPISLTHTDAPTSAQQMYEDQQQQIQLAQQAQQAQIIQLQQENRRQKLEQRREQRRQQFLSPEGESGGDGDDDVGQPESPTSVIQPQTSVSDSEDSVDYQADSNDADVSGSNSGDPESSVEPLAFPHTTSNPLSIRPLILTPSQHTPSSPNLLPSHLHTPHQYYYTPQRGLSVSQELAYEVDDGLGGNRYRVIETNDANDFDEDEDVMYRHLASRMYGPPPGKYMFKPSLPSSNLSSHGNENVEVNRKTTSMYSNSAPKQSRHNGGNLSDDGEDDHADTGIGITNDSEY